MLLSSLDTEEQRSFFLEIYVKYYGMLLCEAKKLVKDSAIAEDMTHDAFLRAEKYISRIMALDCCVLPKYLVTILKTVCYTYLSKPGSCGSSDSLSFDELDIYITDPDVDVEAQALRSLEIRRLKAAVKLLPKPYQDVLNFKYLLDMDNASIGKALGIKTASVRQYLTRARRLCYSIAVEMEESSL